MAADIVNGFVSPGYAVAGALQDILARKTAERHQALLDELAQKNADTNRMETEARMENLRAEGKRWEEQANQGFASQYGMGQTLTPEDISELTKRGFGGSIKDTPVEPSLSEEGPQLPQKAWAGTPKERAESETKQKFIQLQQSDAWKNGDALTRWTLANSLGIHNMDPKDFQDPPKDTEDFVAIDPIKGTVKRDPSIQLPKGKGVIELKREPTPPQGPAPHYTESEVWTPVDPTKPEGPKVFRGWNVMQNNGSVKFQPAPADSPQSLGKPSASTSKPPEPKTSVWKSSGTLSSYNTARQIAATPGVNPQNPARIKAIAQSIGNLRTLVATAELSPGGQAVLAQAAQGIEQEIQTGQPDPTPWGKLDAQTFAEVALRTGKISAEEVPLLAGAIRQLRGREK